MDIADLRASYQELLTKRRELDTQIEEKRELIERLEGRTNLSRGEILELLANEEGIDNSWMRFLAENNADFVVNVIVSSWINYTKDVHFLRQALFLVCAVAEEEVALLFIDSLYERLSRRDFVKVFHLSLSLVDIENSNRIDGSEYLPGYDRMIKIYIQYFGYERALELLEHSNENAGYVIAEIYQQGYPLERIDFNLCLSHIPCPLLLLMDILDGSPVELFDVQVKELAIYALRNFDIRPEYEEIKDKKFHDYLILNSSIEGILPANIDIRPFLETFGYCEDDV